MQRIAKPLLTFATLPSRAKPRMLLHGIPFVESDIISPSPTMSLLRKAEKSARDVLKESSTSLTVSRICEHTEILHLLEAVEMIGQLDYMRTFSMQSSIHYMY